MNSSKSLSKNDLNSKTTVQSLLLEPFLTQLNSLLMNNAGSVNIRLNNKLNRSKSVNLLLEQVVNSIETFLALGAEIAQENPELHDYLMQAIENVSFIGTKMAETSRDFAGDPLNQQKRLEMVKASRDLLNSISKLLSIAELIDANLLLRSIQIVQQDLNNLKNSNNQDELVQNFKSYNKSLKDLTYLTCKRQAIMNNSQPCDELAAANATLNNNKIKLFSSSKTLIHHSELPEAQENHSIIYKELFDALEQIHGIVTNRMTNEYFEQIYQKPTNGSVLLDELENQINFNPNEIEKSLTPPNLENQVENVLKFAATLADTESTRSYHRDRIVNECNSLRQRLHNLINAYYNNSSCGGSAEQIHVAIGEMSLTIKKLRKQLAKSVIDQISDSFIQVCSPLENIVESAKQGDEQQLSEYVKLFMNQTEKVIQTGSIACSMSTNFDVVRLASIIFLQVQALAPQIINAARILCFRNNSQVAQENLNVFRDAWHKNMKLLIESIDDITNLNEFLSVSENHILEDLNNCVTALRDQDVQSLDRIANIILSRSSRICDVVLAEADLYEQDDVINKIVEAVSSLKNQLIPNFENSVAHALNSFSSQPIGDPNDNGFIEASRIVYDGIHDIRNAVLMLYEHGYEDDSQIGDEMLEENTNDFSNDVEISNYQSNAHYTAEIEPEPLKEDQFNNFPQEQREQIKRQLESFRREKKNFDKEVLKWDDKSNDIVVLAKQMCVIMMEMTDFTRGRGPLKSTMDIITAAKKISECGTKLDKLAREIANECPESQSKRELDAYLKPIPLFCNQLNIASKVKANVVDISGGQITSCIDSATSLIISAKNLMTSVVSVVKASYVASTKYTSKIEGRKAIVQWRMKAPEKKPLILTAKSQEVCSRVKKASQIKRIEPIIELSEFQ